MARGARVVRHQHHRRPPCTVGVADEGQDLLAGPRVEVAGRLVGEDQGGIDHQRARDRHALHLAARELVGPMAAAVPEPDQVERRLHALAHVARAAAVEEERQRDVLLGGIGGQEVEELEHEADPPPPEDGDLVVAHAGDGRPVDDDLARRRHVETAHQVEQRALPRAARPHDRHELARRDVERHAGQRAHLGLALAEDLVDVADGDHGVRLAPGIGWSHVDSNHGPPACEAGALTS